MRWYSLQLHAVQRRLRCLLESDRLLFIVDLVKAGLIGAAIAFLIKISPLLLVMLALYLPQPFTWLLIWSVAFVLFSYVTWMYYRAGVE